MSFLVVQVFRVTSIQVSCHAYDELVDFTTLTVLGDLSKSQSS